jgi:hypothetical protein
MQKQKQTVVTTAFLNVLKLTFIQWLHKADVLLFFELFRQYKIVALKFILCFCALCSDQSFVDIDDMSVPMSFESANEDPIDISVPMSFESLNEDPIEINPLKMKKWARSANYSPQEDEALVMAWESVSLDPIIGTDQSSNTYWNHWGCG